jgi:drug/metabolite transporter (DMT)-like permease
MSARAWGYLVFLSVLWGVSFLFNRLAVLDIPPVTVVFLRLFVAAIVLGGVLAASRQKLPTGTIVWRDYAVMAVLNNVLPFILIVWAQKHIDAGLASILNALTPIFSVVFSHVLTTDDKATPNKIAGVLIGLLGVAILVGIEALGSAGNHLLPELAMVLATALYGLSSVWSRRFRGRPPVTTTTCVSIAASVLLLPASLVVDAPWTLPMPGWPAILSVLGSAILSTALAYLVFYRLITIAGGPNTMLVTLLIPVSAIATAALFLGEHLQWHQAAGMTVIALGLVAIDGRALAWLRTRPA